MNIDIEKEIRKDVSQEEIGFIMWKVESIEKFFPCYQSIMRK